MPSARHQACRSVLKRIRKFRNSCDSFQKFRNYLTALCTNSPKFTHKFDGTEQNRPYAENLEVETVKPVTGTESTQAEAEWTERQGWVALLRPRLRRREASRHAEEASLQRVTARRHAARFCVGGGALPQGGVPSGGTSFLQEAAKRTRHTVTAAAASTSSS